MSAPTKLEVIHAYRHLYRGLLQAVLFSKPARYTARDTLRDAFRTDPPHMYNQKRIDKTVEFLQYAAKETGLEHKILRNLLLMKYSQKSQRPFRRSLQNRPEALSTISKLEKTATVNFDMTLAMLNDSMGLCLR